LSRRARVAAALAVALAVTAAAASLGAAADPTVRQVLGHSVQGRPLVAVRVGDRSSPRKALVVGNVHGDEPAGTAVTREILRRFRAIRGVDLWVVPTANPDGLAAGTRRNAHGVDLNRNFPFAWRPLGGGEYSGPHPLSEPESRAARDLIRRTDPAITIWFHQPFGLVDRSGGDIEIERRYAQLSGLPLIGLRRHPGSASSWQNHAMRSTAFVVELPAVVSGALVRRATRATLALAAEYAGGEVAGGRSAR
jgi:protein MpaA